MDEQPEVQDEDGEKAIAFLRSLPAGAEVTWTSHHLSAESPYTRGWVDVYTPELCEAAGWNWGFTVEEPLYYQWAAEGEADLPIAADDPFSFPASFDGILELQLGVDGRPSRLRLLCANGERLELTDELPAINGDEWWQQRVHFRPGDSDFDGRTYPAISHQVEIDGELWWQTEVWTPVGISAALTIWVTEHADRDDLKVRWVPDLDSPGKRTVAEAAEIAEAIDRGDQETYEMGEGVRASSAVFDFLLAMGPDEAAKLTEQVQKLRERLAE
jgi:hypothetical protein